MNLQFIENGGQYLTFYIHPMKNGILVDLTKSLKQSKTSHQFGHIVNSCQLPPPMWHHYRHDERIELENITNQLNINKMKSS